jgi:hypothetical protein
MTVAIEGSSERDVATNSRAAGGTSSEIFIRRCPDPVLAHHARGGDRGRRRPCRRCRKCGHSGQCRYAGNVPDSHSWSRSRRNHAGIRLYRHARAQIRPDIPRLCRLHCNIRSSDAPCCVKFLRWLTRSSHNLTSARLGGTAQDLRWKSSLNSFCDSGNSSLSICVGHKPFTSK